MMIIPLFTGFYVSQVVQDFVHHQYDAMEVTIYKSSRCNGGFTGELRIDVPSKSRQICRTLGPTNNPRCYMGLAYLPTFGINLW